MINWCDCLSLYKVMADSETVNRKNRDDNEEKIKKV